VKGQFQFAVLEITSEEISIENIDKCHQIEIFGCSITCKFIQLNSIRKYGTI
jgi:hypothetical protein